MADEVRRRRRSPSQTAAKLDALAQSMTGLSEAVREQGDLLREVREQVAEQHGTLKQIAHRQEGHSKAIGILQQGLGQVQGALMSKGKNSNGNGNGNSGPRWWEQWGRTMTTIVGVAGAIGAGLAALWQALKGGSAP